MTTAPMAAPIALPRYMADEFNERLTGAKAGFIATSRTCCAVIIAHVAKPQSSIAGGTTMIARRGAISAPSQPGDHKALGAYRKCTAS